MISANWVPYITHVSDHCQSDEDVDDPSTPEDETDTRGIDKVDFEFMLGDFLTDSNGTVDQAISESIREPAISIIVDDFESYTDDLGNRISETWRDGYGCAEAELAYPGNGTGSMVGLSVDVVRSGVQLMKLDYDNTGTAKNIFGDQITAYYSEAERGFYIPQDWTTEGAKALLLCFYGDPCNAAEQMYVAVEDNMGMSKLVNHPNPNALLLDAWQEWSIDLQEFSDAGVDLTSVKKMYIGVGDRDNPQAGGMGTLYFDDITLGAPRCECPPIGDLNFDWVVDFKDLAILASNWLEDKLGPCAEEKRCIYESKLLGSWGDFDCPFSGGEFCKTRRCIKKEYCNKQHDTQYGQRMEVGPGCCVRWLLVACDHTFAPDCPAERSCAP